VRAVTVSDYGASPVVMDLPTPAAGPGQVLIKLAAAGLDPMDAKLASGEWRPNRPHRGRDQKGRTTMPNAVVMTGYGPPEVLKWAGVPLPEPGQGQIRIKVKAAGISPTDLALRAGYLKAFPLPPDAVLGFEAAGTVDAAGPGVTGTSPGDAVTALLLSLGGYAEYAVASTWTSKPESVS
jgi:NADPH:quinone reductase-like Zn-dependent oxidoreductase